MKQVTLVSTIYSMIADWTVWAADMQNDIDNLQSIGRGQMAVRHMGKMAHATT